MSKVYHLGDCHLCASILREITRKMRVHLSIGLLLVSASFGQEESGNALYEKEVKKLRESGELAVYDGAGKLVKITMEDCGPKKDPKPVTFHLFTKENNTVHQEPLRVNDIDKLKKSKFRNGAPTRFVTHGWANLPTGPSCTLIRDAYLAGEEGNVIVVGWSDTSRANYIWAASHIDTIGRQIATMVEFIIKKGPLDRTLVTLVGHSMGAHIMGLAGHYCKAPVNNIVALDPALPMFNFAGPDDRLSKEDAKNVQVIHTNAGTFGFSEAIGHSDFYPNGGAKQPGCCEGTALICGACSNQRAVHLFRASISQPFDAVQCDTYDKFKSGACKSNAHSPMGGINLEWAKPGIFYLTTKSPLST